MMKKLKMVGLVSAAMFVSTTALAAWSSSQGLIDAIEIDGTGTNPQTYVGFATTPGGKPSCGSGTGWTLFVGSADTIKAMTTIATSAFLAGRNVEAHWDGTCTSGYARIDAIRLR